VQELPEPLDVPPSGFKQAIDTTTGEAPAQVMVSVRAGMSATTVATVVPAAFFTVNVEVVAAVELEPVIVQHTVESFFQVEVMVIVGRLLMSISSRNLTPLAKHPLIVSAVGVVVGGVGQAETPHITVVCSTQAPSGLQGKSRSR
jgi:hypothetical protein